MREFRATNQALALGAGLFLSARAFAQQPTAPPMKMPGKIEHRGGAPSRPAAPAPAPVPAASTDPVTQARALLAAHRAAEADRLLRSALVVESSRADAARMLWELDDATTSPMPLDDGEVTALAATLGPGFARFESAHIVMLSDAMTERVNARLGTLERTRTEFIKWAKRIGLNPSPESSKHLCVLFATRDDYVSFSRVHDGLDASHLGGHYSPSKQRMVLYADAPGLPNSEALTVRAVHEAVHMVSYGTLTQTRRRTQPFWLSEGLAAAFEPTGEAPLAPDRSKPRTREQFMLARERPDAMVPLDTLIALTAPPREDPSAAGAMYRASEALVRYLARHRKRDLAAYMESVVTDEPGPRPPTALREEFIRHFGEPAAIERDMTLRPW